MVFYSQRPGHNLIAGKSSPPGIFIHVSMGCDALTNRPSDQIELTEVVEATEIVVAAEVNGRVVELSVNQGDSDKQADV